MQKESGTHPPNTHPHKTKQTRKKEPFDIFSVYAECKQSYKESTQVQKQGEIIWNRVLKYE